MNILPKKSWHVRNKDNIERVRKDEENARLEEAKLAKRAALAEQEARTKLLRDRAHSQKLPPDEPCYDHNSGESTLSLLPHGEKQTKHVNLFEDEESGNVSLKGTNVEYEAEKKDEQEKKEKALGILKYLGQSTVEGDTPWYIKKKTDNETSNITKPENSKDIDRKNRLDPLSQMNSFLTETKKSKEKKKQKKEKRKDKKAKKTIEELRYERLQREKQGKVQADKLIQDMKKGNESKTTQEVEDPFDGRYNSQYNPDLARKPKYKGRYNPY